MRNENWIVGLWIAASLWFLVMFSAGASFTIFVAGAMLMMFSPVPIGFLLFRHEVDEFARRERFGRSLERLANRIG